MRLPASIGVSVLGIALSVWLSGCDGGGDGGALGSVPGHKRLSELTEAETVELCEGGRDVARRDPAAMSGACLITASLAASFEAMPGTAEAIAACERVREDCESGLKEEPCEPEAFSPTCTATVADFRNCLEVSADAFGKLADTSCEEATSDGNDVLAASLDGLDECDQTLDGCFTEPDDCCDAADSCDYADDGICDCEDQAWDEADCG